MQCFDHNKITLSTSSVAGMSLIVFNKASTSLFAEAIAVGVSEVESDPHGSGRPS